MTTPPATTMTFVVPGMSCGHCKAAVSGEVRNVAGVDDVAVNLDTKVVTVLGRSLDRAAIVAAIDEAGFTALAPGDTVAEG